MVGLTGTCFGLFCLFAGIAVLKKDSERHMLGLNFNFSISELVEWRIVGNDVAGRDF